MISKNNRIVYQLSKLKRRLQIKSAEEDGTTILYRRFGDEFYN